MGRATLKPKIIWDGVYWKCSYCPLDYFWQLGGAQAHILEKHPQPKRKKQFKPEKEKFPRPTASERREIRKMIQEAKNRGNLPR